MQHYAAFHLGLHCLQKCPFKGFPEYKGLNRMLKDIVKKVYERNGKRLFWYVKNSGEILIKLKSKYFLVCSLSTYDFSTLYTTCLIILSQKSVFK